MTVGMITLQVSPSRLKMFGDCANQYRYRYIDGLAGDSNGSLTVLGSVWHYSVDVYETYGHDLDLALRTFNKYWANPEGLGLHVDFWHNRTTFDSLKKKGRYMLRRYHELRPWEIEGRLAGTEVPFNVPIGKHRIRGIIDKLFVMPGNRTIQVIDFKTGSYVPAKLKHNLQFTAYCYATTRKEFWENVPGHTDGFHEYASFRRTGLWFHARNTKGLNAGFRNEDAYRRLALAVDEMDRSINLGVFPLSYSGDTCGWCPYTEICGGEMQLREGTNGIEYERKPIV